MEAITIEDILCFDGSYVFYVVSEPKRWMGNFITPGDISVLYQKNSIEKASLKAGWISKKFIEKSLNITHTYT